MREITSAPSSTVIARGARALKRRLAVLKGWITRKRIRILDHPNPDAFFVEYQDEYRRTIAWCTSPNGRADADTIRQYLETRAQLRSLKAL
ncbi:MAG: hypothetical protein ACFFCO_11455 [Promethearchaeota archaeon]